MKANILMKIAVVFMAAFGAYAFSGNDKSSTFKRSDTCTNIEANCSNSGNFLCKVLVENDQLISVMDFYCELPIKHFEEKPVLW